MNPLPISPKIFFFTYLCNPLGHSCKAICPNCPNFLPVLAFLLTNPSHISSGLIQSHYSDFDDFKISVPFLSFQGQSMNEQENEKLSADYLIL